MPFHKGLLPREGFFGDVILRLIDRTLLNPSLLLPLILFARYTKRGHNLSVVHEKAFGRIKKLFYLSLVKSISKYISGRARDNWTSDRYDWSREIVLVTGGAGGIGGAMVKFFDELGIKVVVIDVQPMSFRASHRVHHFTCDIRSPEKVNAIADEIRAKVGHPTVLINNAGVARGKYILDAEPGDVRFTFDVNTLAHYWLAKAFLPNMVRTNHGMVVTVASLASWITAPKMVDYAASKAAALAFHEGLASELATVYNATKVRTVVVHPAHTRSDLFKGFDQNDPFFFPTLHTDSMAEAVVRQVLTGRSGQVVLPTAGRLVQLLRVVPDFVSSKVRNDGAHYMKEWKGRQVITDVDADFEGKEASESTVLVGKE